MLRKDQVVWGGGECILSEATGRRDRVRNCECVGGGGGSGQNVNKQEDDGDDDDVVDDNNNNNNNRQGASNTCPGALVQVES